MRIAWLVRKATLVPCYYAIVQSHPLWQTLKGFIRSTRRAKYYPACHIAVRVVWFKVHYLINFVFLSWWLEWLVVSSVWFIPHPPGPCLIFLLSSIGFSTPPAARRHTSDFVCSHARAFRDGKRHEIYLSAFHRDSSHRTAGYVTTYSS